MKALVASLLSSPTTLPAGSKSFWPSKFASLLGKINTLGDQENVLAIKELVDGGTLTGMTRDIATGVVTRLAELWECALRVGSDIERASRAVGDAPDHAHRVGNTPVLAPLENGCVMLGLSADTMKLGDLFEALEAEISTVTADVAALMSANSLFEAARAGAARSGLSVADRMTIEGRGATDPLGAAADLTRMETEFLRSDGIRRQAIAEAVAARRWLDYLRGCPMQEWTAEPFVFLDAWLERIENGPLAGNRWHAVTRGLMAWGSLTRRIELKMFGTDNP